MKVLVVEDEPLLASTLAKGLRAEGCAVVGSSNGVDGLSQAIENDFDVIVLDIMLPGLSGYEVLRRLRARDVWTPAPTTTSPDRSRSWCWWPGYARWFADPHRNARRS